MFLSEPEPHVRVFFYTVARSLLSFLFSYCAPHPPPPPNPPPENPPPPEPLPPGADDMADESELSNEFILAPNAAILKGVAPAYHEGAGGSIPISFIAFASWLVTPKIMADGSTSMKIFFFSKKG